MRRRRAGAAAARRRRSLNRWPRDGGFGSRPGGACSAPCRDRPSSCPVSSSAHLRIVPWLLGWDLDDVSAEDRKAFEVAVHGGAALALLIGQRRLIVDELRRLDGRRIAVIACSFLPAVAVGLALEDGSTSGSAARGPPRSG